MILCIPYTTRFGYSMGVGVCHSAAFFNPRSPKIVTNIKFSPNWDITDNSNVQAKRMSGMISSDEMSLKRCYKKNNYGDQ